MVVTTQLITLAVLDISFQGRKDPTHQDNYINVNLHLDKVVKINSGCKKYSIFTRLLSCVKVCKYGTSMQYHHEINILKSRLVFCLWHFLKC